MQVTASGASLWASSLWICGAAQLNLKKKKEK